MTCDPHVLREIADLLYTRPTQAVRVGLDCVTIELSTDQRDILVRACNAHDALVEALEELIAMDDEELLAHGSFKKANAALAKAKEGAN